MAWKQVVGGIVLMVVGPACIAAWWLLENPYFGVIGVPSLFGGTRMVIGGLRQIRRPENQLHTRWAFDPWNENDARVEIEHGDDGD